MLTPPFDLVKILKNQIIDKSSKMLTPPFDLVKILKNQIIDKSSNFPYPYLT